MTKGRWGDLEKEPVELDNCTALTYEDHILFAVFSLRGVLFFMSV
jgi:hypothetical protein